MKKHTYLEHLQEKMFKKMKEDLLRLHYTAQEGSLLDRIWHPEKYKKQDENKNL